MGVTEHFRPTEQAFVKQVQDWQNQAANEYRAVLTPFLNPRQRYIVATLLATTDDLKVISHPAFQNSEAQRLLIAPDYVEPDAADFEMTRLALKYPEKFVSLKHHSILGALVHTGIDRERIGDIITDGQGAWQVVVATPIARFLQQEGLHIGRTTIEFVPREPAEALLEQQAWEAQEVLVASWRLDVVVATAYKLSRAEAKELIQKGHVRVNWMDQTHPDDPVDVHDLISVRRYGRIRIDVDAGVTRRDKQRLGISILKNR